MKKIVVLPIMVLAAGLLTGCNSRPASDCFVDISNPEYEKYFEVPDNLERLGSSAIDYVVSMARSNVAAVNKFTLKTLNGIGYRGSNPHKPSGMGQGQAIGTGGAGGYVSSPVMSDLSEQDISYEWFSNGYIEYNSIKKESSLIDNVIQELSTNTEKETYWYNNELDDDRMYPIYTEYEGSISGLTESVKHQNVYDKSKTPLTLEDTRINFLSVLDNYLNTSSINFNGASAVADDNNIYLIITDTYGGVGYSDTAVSKYFSSTLQKFAPKLAASLSQMFNQYSVSFVLNPLKPLSNTGGDEYGTDYKAFLSHFLPITHVETTVIHAKKGEDNSWYYDYSAYKDETKLLKNEYDIELAKPVSFEVDYQLSFMDYSEAKEHEVKEIDEELFNKFGMTIQTQMRGVSFDEDGSYEIDPETVFKYVSSTTTVTSRWHRYKYAEFMDYSGGKLPVVGFGGVSIVDYSQYYWQVHPELEEKDVHVFKGVISTSSFLQMVGSANNMLMQQKLQEINLELRTLSQKQTSLKEQMTMIEERIKKESDTDIIEALKKEHDKCKSEWEGIRITVEEKNQEMEKVKSAPLYNDAFVFSFQILKDDEWGYPYVASQVGYADLQNALAVKGKELLPVSEGEGSDWEDCARILNIAGDYTQYINITMYVTEDGEIYNEGGNYGLAVDLVQSSNGGLPGKDDILVVDDPLPFITRV